MEYKILGTLEQHPIQEDDVDDPDDKARPEGRFKEGKGIYYCTNSQCDGKYRTLTWYNKHILGENCFSKKRSDSIMGYVEKKWIARYASAQFEKANPSRSESRYMRTNVGIDLDVCGYFESFKRVSSEHKVKFEMGFALKDFKDHTPRPNDDQKIFLKDLFMEGEEPGKRKVTPEDAQDRLAHFIGSVASPNKINFECHLYLESFGSHLGFIPFILENQKTSLFRDGSQQPVHSAQIWQIFLPVYHGPFKKTSFFIFQYVRD